MMPKFIVHLAKEVTTMYYIEVDAKDADEAEAQAWKDYNAGYSSIIDKGVEIHENEYIEYVDADNGEIQNA
jgi:hypothetical protein